MFIFLFEQNAKTGRRAQSKQAKAPPAPDFETSPGGDSPQPAQDLVCLLVLIIINLCTYI